MSVYHAEHVYDLTRVSSQNIPEEIHAERVCAIIGDWPKDWRVERVLKQNIAIHGSESNEKYLADMVEALFVANYGEADKLLESVTHYMTHVVSDAAAELYPLIAIGAIRTSLWCGVRIPHNNNFEEEVPGYIGKWFYEFAMANYRPRITASTWARGQLANLIPPFLDGRGGRTQKLLAPMVSIDGMNPEVLPLFRDLTHKMFGTMSVKRQLVVLTGAFTPYVEMA